MIHLLLLVFAIVCFTLSAFGAAAPHWNKLISAGLAFLAASFISWPVGG